MFIHTIPKQVDINGACLQPALTFVKSLNVKAYPCGSRRSERKTFRPADGGGQVVDKVFYIPFDPEARLSTEANNRRFIGLNGRIPSYVAEWVDTDSQAKTAAAIKGKLSLVIDGYSFKIEHEYTDVNGFVTALLNAIAQAGTTRASRAMQEPEIITKIYANIRLEETPLYTGDMLDTPNYTTPILRNQNNTATPAVSIDELRTDGNPDDSNDYYFAGLTFSTLPLTLESQQLTNDHAGFDYTTNTQSSVKLYNAQGEPTQQVVSLCVFVRKKDDQGAWTDNWKINPLALLPNIERCTSDEDIHTDGSNSLGGIRVGDLKADDVCANELRSVETTTSKLTVDSIVQKDTSYAIPALHIVTKTYNEPTARHTYQLNFATSVSKAKKQTEAEEEQENI